jgi:hypothetical protein
MILGGFAGAWDPTREHHTARFGGPSRKVEVYDAAEDRWSALPEMLEARQGCGAVLLPLPRTLPMTMAERGGGALTPEQRTDWGQQEEDGAMR